jgi:hypothetical protein
LVALLAVSQRHFGFPDSGGIGGTTGLEERVFFFECIEAAPQIFDLDAGFWDWGNGCKAGWSGDAGT